MIQKVCLCKTGLSFVRIELTVWGNPSWKCMVCWLCKLPGTLCSWSRLLYTPKGNTSLEKQYGYYVNFKIQYNSCFIKQTNPPGNIAILANHKTCTKLQWNFKRIPAFRGCVPCMSEADAHQCHYALEMFVYICHLEGSHYQTANMYFKWQKCI